MPKYIVLLRGINVGGNILKMDRLRALCEELGCDNPKTLLQSGNIVLDSKLPAPKLAAALEKRLVGEARLPVSVIVRTPEDFEKIVAGNPFLSQKAIDRTKLHITFLAATAPRDAAAKLQSIQPGKDRFHIAAKEIYLHCPGGYGETKLSNNALQKALNITATTRNWNTVNKLLEL